MEESIESREQPHSVKWSMNAKGQIAGECKVYADTPEDALKKATEIIKQMEVIIKEKNSL